MFEDVAMPDVLVATRTWANRHTERHRRQVDLHNDRSHFARVHAHRFLPAQLIWIRIARRSGVERRAWLLSHIERLASQDLNVHEVEMDGVRVASEIRNLPNLGGPGVGSFSRRII